MSIQQTSQSLFLFFSFLLLTGCIKDKVKDININYTGTLAFPVAQVGFTVEEAIDGDSIYVVDDENAVKLIYRDEDFYTLTASEYLDDITGDLVDEHTESFQIGSINIDDTFAEGELSFAELVDDFDDQSLKQYFLQNDGNSLPVPAFVEDIDDNVDVPMFADFTLLEVESGLLRLSVSNGLFFDVINLTATIIDEVYQTEVGTVTFDLIEEGAIATEILDLSGKVVSNDFRMELGNLETPGTAGAPASLDLQSSLLASIEITNVVIHSGQVELDAGTYHSDEFLYEIEFDGEERLYRMELDEAALDYSYTSELETDFLLRMTFDDVLTGGNPTIHEVLVEKTPNGNSTGTLDFSNSMWRLDQDAAQPFNRMTVTYEVVLPTGTPGQINFSAEDEVSFQLLVNGLEPSLVEGYLGKKTEIVDEDQIDLGADFSIFEEGSSSIFFENPELRIEVNNSFGVPLLLDFDAKAFGHFGEESQLLLPNPLVINKPGIVGQSVMTEFIFDKNNSNLVDVLSIYPVSLSYSGVATANPEIDPSITNFVTAESELSATTEFELPFKFSVQNLIYRENGAAINLDLEEGLTIDDIDSAVVKVSYHNELPLNAKFKMSTIAPNGDEVVFIEGVLLEAAMANPAGRVEESGVAHGEIFVRLSRSQIQQLDDALENSYTISFMTPDELPNPLAIYSDYNVNINIGIAITFDR